MGNWVLQKMAEKMSACSRNVARAVRKIRRRGHTLSRLSTATVRPFLSQWQRPRGKIADRKTRIDEEKVKEVEREEGVWRRSILMGEKCQPLDFSGVIYYDVDGRPLSEVPVPRSPLRSPLPSNLHRVTAGYDAKRDDI